MGNNAVSCQAAGSRRGKAPHAVAAAVVTAVILLGGTACSTVTSGAAARAKVRALIDEGPERVVMAHGQIVRSGGAAYLRRAFSWLL